MLADGCIFQERLGWERPGWFNSSEAPVQKYDWYQSYGNEANSDQRYVDALKQEYSFDYPVNEKQVRHVVFNIFMVIFFASPITVY